MASKTFLVSLFLVLAVPLAGQNNIRFESYSVDDGLSSNRVSCSYQDHKGWIWLGTSNGISKYNGHDFQTYSLNNPFTSETYSLVNCIYEDSKSRLWVGTEEAGLALYDRSMDDFTYFSTDSSRNCISSNLVYSLAEDSSVSKLFSIFTRILLCSVSSVNRFSVIV